MMRRRITTIDVQELKKRLVANPNLYLIDVREHDEWAILRIPGAMHLPKDELPRCIEALVPYRDSPIYLHCKGGIRSLVAADCLIEMGYTDVYSVDGGIAEWVSSGFPVDSTVP